MTFGDRIRELRAADDRTIAYVARKVGMNRAHVKDLEEGGTTNPRILTVEAFAKHYGMTIDQIWSGTETKQE